MVGYLYSPCNSKGTRDAQEELPGFRTNRLRSCRVNSSKEPREHTSPSHQNKFGSNANIPAPSPAVRVCCLMLSRVFSEIRVPTEKLCTTLPYTALRSGETRVFLSISLRSHVQHCFLVCTSRPSHVFTPDSFSTLKQLHHALLDYHSAAVLFLRYK